MKSETRIELAAYEGTEIKCSGFFTGVRILKSGLISLLISDAVINGEIGYSHIWVMHSASFDGVDIRPGVKISFIGTVKRYLNDENRCGIGDVRNVVVRSYDRDMEQNAFSDLTFQMKTIRCNNVKNPGKEDVWGYAEFSADYEFEPRKKVEILYSPALTAANMSHELEFDMYDEQGKMAEFDKISFNPYTDGHRISVDDKYYIDIGESIYRKLCMLYYMVVYSQYKCMSYIPRDTMCDYIGQITQEGITFYYQGKSIYSLCPRRRMFCDGRAS